MASVEHPAEDPAQQRLTNGTNNDHKIDSKHDDVVAKINLSIDENNVIDGAREVLKVIRAQWNSNDIKFKVRLKKIVF